MQGVALRRWVCGLVQIWQFADQGRTGFLSRVEFYNALKLVTVAQTGREITPEIVRAALTGPAAAQIPPPRINPARGQAGGGGGAPAAVASSHGAGPVRAPGPGASAGPANRQEAQARSLQGSNDGMNGRQAGVLGNGLGGSQGAPAKQFSPHTNSAPSAPMPQGGYGGAAKQLAPQTNSLSAGGSGVPQLTSQSSGLSRYPSSAGQLQVPPSGFAQQGWARPPAGGGPPTRPSLGSLFTTNSAWPPKESNGPSASQGSGVSSVTTTPSSGQSRPVTPASSASTVTVSNAGAGTTTAATTTTMGSQGPAASSTKGGSAGAGFNGGMDLFSSGFKASTPSESGSIAAVAGGASGSEGAKAASVPAGPSQAKQAVALPLDESLFSGPAIPSVQMSAQGPGRGPVGGAIPQGGPRGGAMDMGPGSGAGPQGGPVAGGSWPQMSANDVQRYTRVFTKVDTDKDGKITGEQARQLFLSWQLPRGSVGGCWAGECRGVGADGRHGRAGEREF